MSSDFRSRPNSESRSRPIFTWVYDLKRVGVGRALRLTFASSLDALTDLKMRWRAAKYAGLGLVYRRIMGLPDYPFVAIGVDPGVTTGVSAFLVTEDGVTMKESYQWGDPENVWCELDKLAFVYENIAHLEVVFVAEQFDKRPGVADPDFTPKYIIKDIETHLAHRTFIWQTPSQAKNLVKPATKGVPDGLKRFGWYQVGMGHANDASRHVIVFLVEKIKHMPTILLGWPKEKK